MEHVLRLRRRLVALGSLAAMPGWALAQTPPPSEARAGPPPAVGSRLEPPDLTLLDGSTLPAAASAGKLLVLYWWASWCPFCAIQSPLMDTLYQAQRGRGLMLVGLSIDKKLEDATAHLAKKGYSFPSAWVSPALQARLPKARGLPVTVVIGRDRKVLMSEAGQLFPEDIDGIARFL